MYSGNCLIMFSKLERYVGLLLYFARVMHFCTGWFAGSVRIRVTDLNILFRNRNCGGGSAVSASSAAVGVVLKHPVIVLMICRCAEAILFNWDVVGAVLVSPGLCHIDAA